MEMTIQEVKQLDKNSYQIIDIRDDNEIAHGAIPGAVAQNLSACPPGRQL